MINLQKYCKFCIPIFFTCFLAFFSSLAHSQIKVYERPTDTARRNTGLFMESPSRKIIPLNGEWNVSFNEGGSFAKFILPLAYDYKGSAIFKKTVSIDDAILENYNFVLVAEGICYDANIKINNIFIGQNAGASSSIIIPIDKDIIKAQNDIEIIVDSELDGRTIPLSNQLNYTRTWGGINKDIYLIAVPRVYTFTSSVSSIIEGSSRAKINSKINIKSFDIGGIKNFTLKTIVKTAAGEIVKESNPAGFNIDNYRSDIIENEIILEAPVLWTPQTPRLYILSTVILDSANNIIDEYNIEYGIKDVKFNKDFITLNGKEYFLNGINYNEDSHRYASALEYGEVERDLMLIKDLGINTIRVEGRAAHPYIVNLCNRLGMFLFQEIPFNEVPEELLADEEYIKSANMYLQDIIERDRNAVSIIAWGIGNNFDVTKEVSASYVKGAKEFAAKLDARPIYYTTFNIDKDICAQHTNLKGVNIIGKSTPEIKKIITELKDTKKSEPSIFISSFGLKVNNENHNGYSDMHSVEAQSKFIADAYTEIGKKFFGNFLSSFADHNSERPLNFIQNANQYLNTDGIFTIYREPKQSAQYVKKMLNSQEQPKILEGNNPANSSYIFIAVGIGAIIIFVFLFANLKRLKDGLWRSLYRPTNFFQLASEQMIIPVTLNIILSLLISLGIGLFTAGILYFYRGNVFYDMIVSNIFYSDGMKILFSEVTTHPAISIITFTIINFLLQFAITMVIYIISVFLRGRIFFKNLYTVSVWSSMPMVVFLPLGTIIYKLGQESPQFIYLAAVFFVLMHIVYVIRLVKGVNVLFNTSTFKTYMYAAVVIVLIYGGMFSYLYFFKATFSTIDLVRSYLAN